MRELPFPHDADMERAVLGAAILTPEAYAEARSLLTEADFFVAAHRAVWAALDGSDLGLAGLVERLRARGQLEACGGAAAVARLVDYSSSGHVGSYTRRLLELGAVRKLMDAARGILNAGARQPEDAGAFAADARRTITEAAAHLDPTQRGPEALERALPGVLADLERQGPVPGVVPTGLPLDDFTGGLWPTMLSIVAGRPSMGKSALALHIGLHAARLGRRVLFCPLEESQRFLVLRLLARAGSVDLHRLVTRRFDGDDYPRIITAAESLHRLPLWIDDRTARTAAQIAQTAALHQRRHGLDLLIVDHLGQVADREETRNVELERICQGLRATAAELNIPVLAMSQLSRGMEGRGDRRPRLSDLRDSGAIEQEAAAVVFLYRPGYYANDPTDPRCELIIAKNRNGPCGVAYAHATLKYMHFRAWDDPTDGAWAADGKRASAMDMPEVPAGGRVWGD